MLPDSDVTYSDLIWRVGSQALSLTTGSFAIFCLYCAGRVSNPDVVESLLTASLILGGVASVIVYCQGKYLS
jgi:hypothetical protein